MLRIGSGISCPLARAKFLRCLTLPWRHGKPRLTIGPLIDTTVFPRASPSRQRSLGSRRARGYKAETAAREATSRAGPARHGRKQRTRTARSRPGTRSEPRRGAPSANPALPFALRRKAVCIGSMSIGCAELTTLDPKPIPEPCRHGSFTSRAGC